ncbi:hypothetical protein [Brasilonema bromeliae]|nr:hypothetical protein [Brasilonema bromeliae]
MLVVDTEPSTPHPGALSNIADSFKVSRLNSYYFDKISIGAQQIGV